MFQIKLNEWLQGRGRASVQWYMGKPEIRRNRLDNLKMELGIMLRISKVFVYLLFFTSLYGSSDRLMTLDGMEMFLERHKSRPYFTADERDLLRIQIDWASIRTGDDPVKLWGEELRNGRKRVHEALTDRDKIIVSDELWDLCYGVGLLHVGFFGKRLSHSLYCLCGGPTVVSGSLDIAGDAALLSGLYLVGSSGQNLGRALSRYMRGATPPSFESYTDEEYQDQALMMLAYMHVNVKGSKDTERGSDWWIRRVSKASLVVRPRSGETLAYSVLRTITRELSDEESFRQWSARFGFESK